MYIGQVTGLSVIMAFVYILQSQVNFRYYIGSTTNLERRINEHNNGQSKYTSLTKPFKLVFSQEFKNIQLAKKIESKLKRFKSRQIIDRIVKDKVIKTGA
ncbi:MAG: GIY-YIG nuclease family protein [Patescibacteria group bacterium]